MPSITVANAELTRLQPAARPLATGGPARLDQITKDQSDYLTPLYQAFFILAALLIVYSSVASTIFIATATATTVDTGHPNVTEQASALHFASEIGEFNAGDVLDGGAGGTLPPLWAATGLTQNDYAKMVRDLKHSHQVAVSLYDNVRNEKMTTDKIFNRKLPYSVSVGDGKALKLEGATLHAGNAVDATGDTVVEGGLVSHVVTDKNVPSSAAECTDTEPHVLTAKLIESGTGWHCLQQIQTSTNTDPSGVGSAVGGISLVMTSARVPYGQDGRRRLGPITCIICFVIAMATGFGIAEG